MGKYMIMYPRHWIDDNLAVEEQVEAYYKRATRYVSVVEMESSHVGLEVLSMVPEAFAKKVVASLNAYESISEEQ